MKVLKNSHYVLLCLLSSPVIAANSDDVLRDLANKHPSFSGLHTSSDGNLIISQAVDVLQGHNTNSDKTVLSQTSKTYTLSEINKDPLIKDLLDVYGTKHFIKTSRDADNPKMLSMSPAEVKSLDASQLKNKDAKTITFRNVKYSFAELYDWYRDIQDDLFEIDDVFFGDISERSNKIHVKVHSAAAIDEVNTLFANKGIPESALSISYDKQQITNDDTLRDAQTDISGGLEITYREDGRTFVCTIGPAVRVNGVRGVLTASHCSQFQNIPDGRVFFQGGNSLGAGTEETEWLRNCVAGRQCTEADGLFIPYQNGNSGSSAIYKTKALNSNNLEIWRKSNGTPRRWNNIYAFGTSSEGDRVYKTGRTSGTTSGDVTAVCVDINVERNSRYICQTEVTGANSSDFATGGDSGAPVIGGMFTNYSYATFAEFLGLHVAGNDVTDYFSPIQAIEDSMGVNIELD